MWWEKLKALRADAKQSLQDVADSAGLAKSFVWEIEQGRQPNIGLLSLIKLAEHFHVTVGYLLGENDHNCRKQIKAYLTNLIQEGVAE